LSDIRKSPREIKNIKISLDNAHVKQQLVSM